MSMRMASVVVLLLGLGATGAVAADRAASVQGAIVRTRTAAAESPAAAMLRQFVADHADPALHAPVGLPATAAMEVARTYQVRDAAGYARAGGGTTAMDLLSGGVADDTVRIVACSGHEWQRWSYAWKPAANGWAAQGYHYARVADCRHAAGGD